MRYKLFGKSGLRVSELALGTMTFGLDWGWGTSKESSKEIFETYANAGGNFIDTANLYTEGNSEKYIGDFVNGNREHFVLSTKYTLRTRVGDPNFSGNHRKNMIQSVNTSLKRLNTEYIDVFWVHAWDFTTPVDEVLRALDDLVAQGKILYVGISDTPAWIVSMSNTMAELRGWTRFVGLQLRYNLIDRSAERDLLPMAEALDIAVMPWSVLGAGLLSGKYNLDTKSKGRIAKAGLKEQELKIVQKVIEVADSIGATPSQAAIAWVLSKQHQHRAPVIPLLGSTNAAQIRDNLDSINVELSPGHIKILDDLSKIDYGFPHEYRENQEVIDFAFGGSLNLIDNHRIF